MSLIIPYFSSFCNSFLCIFYKHCRASLPYGIAAKYQASSESPSIHLQGRRMSRWLTVFPLLPIPPQSNMPNDTSERPVLRPNIERQLLRNSTSQAALPRQTGQSSMTAQALPQHQTRWKRLLQFQRCHLFQLFPYRATPEPSPYSKASCLQTLLPCSTFPAVRVQHPPHDCESSHCCQALPHSRTPHAADQQTALSPAFRRQRLPDAMLHEKSLQTPFPTVRRAASTQ